jgi:two-component system cell cycle sensor histidine kinase/response regulator CckA
MTDALRLFLIEDDDDVALLIRKHLERAGHHVTRCRTAADALIVLGHTSFDLVLLDHKLPDTSGFDLLTTLAREGIAVPVLMVTGVGDEQLATRVLRAGALDYVVKDNALTFLGELPKRVSESVTRHRLEQMNRLLVQALESARDGIMITDLQGTILKVNQALEQLTGYSRQEMLGQTPRLFKSNVHGPEVYAQLWCTILARGSWQGELTNRRKDGTRYQASMTISPIVDSQGRLTHFVGIQRDVSEHKRLERQLLQAQKMQSVGTLAGGVAHEFNNLLAGISGYAALGLREPDVSPTTREFLQHIVDLSERAAVLTRQLLAFARKPALQRQRTSMAELVHNTAALVRRTLHLEVEVEVAASGGVPLVVEADANQLQQALVNLALNARDAVLARRPDEVGSAGEESPVPPPIRFRVSRLVLEQTRTGFPQHVPAGDYVVLEVEDCGCGMSGEVLNQALDPFFTTKEVGRGTGLGLPMVFGIVQGHQGYLTIDSTPGKGTRIGLYLPRPVSPDAAARPRAPHHPEVLEPESTPGHAILVIDDEEAVLDVVCRFLQIAGHQVICANSGHEALELLGNGRPVDLIILDLMMPREDAAVTFARLRQRRPEVPVLLCTGLPQADPAPALLREGACGLIRKPFRMNELWYAVNRALGEEKEEG